MPWRVHRGRLLGGQEVVPHAPIIGTWPEALLIIDFQNDFTPGGALAVPDGDRDRRAPERADRLRRLRLRGRDPRLAPARPRSFVDQGGPWPPHCVQGTQGAELHPALDARAHRRDRRRGLRARRSRAIPASRRPTSRAMLRAHGIDERHRRRAGHRLLRQAHRGRRPAPGIRGDRRPRRRSAASTSSPATPSARSSELRGAGRRGDLSVWEVLHASMLHWYRLVGARLRGRAHARARRRRCRARAGRPRALGRQLGRLRAPGRAGGRVRRDRRGLRRDRRQVDGLGPRRRRRDHGAARARRPRARRQPEAMALDLAGTPVRRPPDGGARGLDRGRGDSPTWARSTTSPTRSAATRSRARSRGLPEGAVQLYVRATTAASRSAAARSIDNGANSEVQMVAVAARGARPRAVRAS